MVGGGWRVGRPPGPEVPAALDSARLCAPARAPGRGGARSPPGGGTTRRKRSGRPPGPEATRRGLRGTSPEGAHESTHAGGRLKGAPVSSGCRRVGEEAQSPGPHSPGIPRSPGPALPARAAISLASLPRRGKRAGWRQPLAPGPGAAHQETGSCSPRRCPSQFEYPREGGPRAQSWVRPGRPGV